MNVRRPVDKSRSFVAVASLKLMDCNPTTKSRDMSLAIVKATSFGVNFEASYPPKVSVALASFGPVNCQLRESLNTVGPFIRYCAPAE